MDDRKDSRESRGRAGPPPWPRYPFLAPYVISAAAAGLAVLLGAGRLPPLLLFLLTAACLTLPAALYYFFSIRPRRAAVAPWREALPCYLSIQDSRLRIIEANDLFRRDFGEGAGEYCYRVYKRRDFPCPECPVLRTFEDGRVHTSEQTVLTLSGEAAEVVVTSAPRYDRAGRLVGVVEMSTNVTELKALQHELELSRRDYKSLFDLVPCYIAVMDRDFRIIESNELFRRDFGDAPGVPCYKAFKKRDDVCPECVVELSFEDGEVHSSEETAVTRDGRPVNLVVYSMPLVGADGEVRAVMEVSTDITEVKRLEGQLTLMGRAVAGMAHRIKNILMGLEGGMFVVDEAMRLNDQATLAEGWEMIGRNVGKVSRLVKELLYCAKKREPKFKDDVCPEELAAEVCELYRERAAAEGIELKLETGPEPHRRTLDPDGLQNILQNLTANAIDACRFDDDETKEKHHVTVRCLRDGSGATVVEVADDGGGVPEDVGRKLFTDFFSTKGTEGTGLGLLVVQKIAEEHGGGVSFTSKEGVGATFRVVLPPVIPPREETPPAGNDSSGA